MQLDDILVEPQLICEKILAYLDAKSLAYFGSCCHKLRKLTNTDKLWQKLCKFKNYEKYEYLLDTPQHPSIPKKTITASPVYVYSELPELENVCHWRDVYNRAEHLLKNWKNGIYYVAPVLKGHKGQVSAFDSNGTIIATGCRDDKLIKIWSIEDLECISTIKFRNDSINCIKIYKEDIITAGDEGVVKIYDKFEGDIKRSLSNNTSGGSINKMIIIGDKLVASFNDKSIRSWSLNTYEIISILRGHDDEIECLAGYDNFLVTGSWDKNGILWDLNHGKKLTTLIGHSEVINCIKIRNNTVVTASSDASLVIWNLEIENATKADGTKYTDRFKARLLESKALIGHQSDIYCIDICDDYIASGGADSLVIVWSFSGDLLYKLTGHLGIVRCIYLDSHKLVTGGDAKKIMVWDYKKGKLLNALHRNPIKLSSMWVNDTKIITASPELESNLTVICYW